MPATGTIANIFSRKLQSGNDLLIRSRTGNAALSAYAAENFMARLRCVIPPDEVNAAGMPDSTAKLDAFEDSLIGALEAASAEVYQLAVATGDGNRDYLFHGARRRRFARRRSRRRPATRRSSCSSRRSATRRGSSRSLPCRRRRRRPTAGRVHGMSREVRRRIAREVVRPLMPKRTDISSILIIGAGPIIIGQAAEFDYSGTSGGQSAEGRGLSRDRGQFEPGDDHDRSGARGRDLHRADHARNRRQDHREGAAGCAAADDGRADGAEHGVGVGQGRDAGAARASS